MASCSLFFIGVGTSALVRRTRIRRAMRWLRFGGADFERHQDRMRRCLLVTVAALYLADTFWRP